MKRIIISAAAMLVLVIGTMPQAQDLVTSTGTLLFGPTVLQTNSSSTHEELPGLGHKFELLGDMQDDSDPENVTNDTISIDTTGGVIGLAFRNLPPGIKITALDTRLGLKYYFIAPRSCAAGSPRVTLLIDSDGDGNFNFAAHGHVNPPLFGGCLPNLWIYENLTDELKRWETTPATVLTLPCGPVGGPTTCTWDELEMRVAAQFPNHKVLGAFLLDGESCSFSPTGCGRAHYDLLTIENRTLENDQDTVKNGS